MITLTLSLIDAGAATPGFHGVKWQLCSTGWSAKQLAILSVPWPACAHWKRELVGREVSEETYRRFLELKGRGYG